MTDKFVHCHTHTEYSILDGAAKLDSLIKAAMEDGQPAISSTDHGNLYAIVEFYKKCKKAGIKYIPGTEAYMAKDSRLDRPVRTRSKIDDGGGDAGKQKLYYHLTVLAENNTGLANLIKLSSKAFLEGFYYKPRADWDMLQEFHEGLIVTSGCLGGLVLQDLLHDDFDGAMDKAGRLQEIFGRDNFFIEIQDHGIPEQHKTNVHLLEIAKRIDAPLLATNDSHYVHRHDAVSHDALLCVQTGALMSDSERFKFHGDEHYLKTAQEMRWLFREVPQACDNTLWIAERSDVSMEFGIAKLPQFPIPDGFADDAEYLDHLVLTGAYARWGGNLPFHILERLSFELDVIKSMGFASYFLILWDIIEFCRREGIMTGPGRGSAAGCSVAYCLGITDLDPIKYDLIFERFLNPSRVSMPDIDLDIDSRHRDSVIRYAAHRFGDQRVAQIITFGQIKARAAVRDATRVLGKPYIVGDKIAKAMPPLLMGRDTPLHACIAPHPDFAEGYRNAADVRHLYANDPEAKEVIEVALGLEGLRRNDGVHAAAVVISDKDLTEYLPVQRKGEGKPLVTQYEMGNVEELGLLKMDFLGLRNIDTIDLTLKLLRKRDIELDLSNIPLNDSKTFEMLQAANTLGVFQLEGSQMRDLLRRLRPTTFDDIAAVVALYRPGPMASNMHNDYADRKNGAQMVDFFHDDARTILAETYGLMIYQEQMMRIAQKFGGYSLAEADNLRKACGKKVRELMAKEKDKLITGIVSQGYTQSMAEYVWGIIEPFADYSFNKSHAYAYGLISYRTAYLKANYPVEYMSALLTTIAGHPDKTALYLHECRHLNIEVLSPDINMSELDFMPTDDNKIRFGFIGVKGMAEASVDDFIIERENGGPYKDFVEFCERVSTTKTNNKRTIEALIYCNAFDSLGHTKRTMIESLSQLQNVNKKRAKDLANGVMSLFDVEKPVLPDLPEYEEAFLVKQEKEALGVFLTKHPLNEYTFLYEDPTVTIVGDLGECISRNVTVVGVVTDIKVIKTRVTGDQMAFVTLEDLTGATEVVLFAKTYKKFGHYVEVDTILRMSGRVEEKDGFLKILGQTLERAQQ